MSVPAIPLNDGTHLPAIGFGTCKLNGSPGAQAIARAIDNGYRLLDSAFSYENEGAVAQAMRMASVPREALRFTSKIPGRHYAYNDALACIEESRYRTRLDTIDLYLLHWPNPAQGLYLEAWSALVEAKERGWVTSIGVCNFLPEHVQALVDASGVKPCVNQIELHPYFPQPEQLAWDKANGIVTQAWSPIGRGNDLQSDPVLQGIARQHGRSVVQVILRWHVQLGSVPLPKASSDQRQRDNLDVFDFELSTQDMAAIATLARPDGRILGQDPAHYQEL
ncbi:2,5-diketo-D-gluconate reductase [Pseudomonas sp. M47T1]|uniref:aldo/keto reductase n=1 Tax=unclassified Pseudomonas TaxID=196821 RepID=UPI00026075B4|nr:aldo/keto reductase [Pseudomonas sp. M47T1]EIK96172.1 2,5-diketo-D-gluconate reductase [Pseudomonas sp. M47T1]